MAAATPSTGFAIWTAVPDWVPLSDTSPINVGLKLNFLSLRQGPLNAEQIKHAGALYGVFRDLAEPTKQHLRIPLDRLNNAKDRAKLVDSAIDLGIALESLFSTRDELGEVRYRVATRAARFLEDTAESRQRVNTIVRKLYDCRSTAVHTGHLDSTKMVMNISVLDLLEEGGRLTSRAIAKAIEHREKVEWPTFDLG
jgi:hypothetical protein